MPVKAPPPIESLTRRLLDAYAASDAPAVLSMVDTQNVAIYGSDASEVVRDQAALLDMLHNDARLWHGSARIGPMDHVSAVISGDIATIFFDTTFTVGDRPQLPLRCAMVWQRHGAKWLVRQAVNVVPTTGQSAAELLAQHAQ